MASFEILSCVQVCKNEPNFMCSNTFPCPGIKHVVKMNPLRNEVIEGRETWWEWIQQVDIGDKT